MASEKPAPVRPLAPVHLHSPTRKWFESVLEEYELDEHHIRLLILAGESWDRGEMAREAIARHGMTFEDRFGSPRARPEVAIERDSRIAFARLLRELGLDVDLPAEMRPPALRSNLRVSSDAR